MATVLLPSSAQPTLKLNNSRSRVCPHCGSREIYRRAPRRIIEPHVVHVFRLFPHWCGHCDRRFYLFSASRERK